MNEVLGGGQGPQPRKMWLGRRPNHKPNPNQAEKNEGPSKARLASIERMMAATEELEERSKDSPRLAGFPRKPVMRHMSRIDVGISKGLCVQPSCSRAALISSAPSGAPCAPEVPCLAGEPYPIMVRQAIRTGLVAVCADDSAWAISV